jgi:hypothetical protein
VKLVRSSANHHGAAAASAPPVVPPTNGVCVKLAQGSGASRGSVRCVRLPPAPRRVRLRRDSRETGQRSSANHMVLRSAASARPVVPPANGGLRETGPRLRRVPGLGALRSTATCSTSRSLATGFT